MKDFYSMNIANNFYRVRNCSTTCEETHYDIKDVRYTSVVHHTLNHQQDDAIITLTSEYQTVLSF